MVELKLPDNTKIFLDRYNSNQGGLSGKFEVENVDSDAMENYLNCFKEWTIAREPTNLTIETSYELINKYESNSVNPNKIQEFIYEVEYYYKILPKYAGLFPSYLLNELCSEKEITLEIDKPWDYLGFKNSKNLNIIGACGDSYGYENTGNIVIEGDCGDLCGNGMTEGKIIVNGNCGCWCGDDMKGGNIVVKGDCGDLCGYNMTGGEIHLNGDYESIGEHSGGKIYHLGTLIYENGVEVI